MSLRQVTAICACNPRRTSPYRPPLHMESSFASWLMARVEIAPETRIGTWKCARCGTIHPVTAAQAGWVTVGVQRVAISPLAPFSGQS